MLSDLIIHAQGLGKAYAIYRRPEDRLKQMLWRRRRRFYDEYWALRDVNLEVRRGETIGLIGRNGAGKSTFLQLICGTLTPTCGELAINGRIAALLELGAGFNPEFSGRENVHLAASILGLNSDQIRDRFDAIAEFAGIGDFIDQPVKFYSSGMYARLAFAVAAHVDADILIVDEILAVGDAAFVQKCMRYIRSFKETGTLFFVSHDTGAMHNLCDRVVWLDRGTVREVGAPRDVCMNYLAAIESEKEGGEGFHIGGARQAAPPTKLTSGLEKDERHEVLKQSIHRNEIELFDFNENSPWFGQRGASILRVFFTDAQGGKLDLLEGGEEVVLNVECQAARPLHSPIIGFYVRDRLGQHLFGDNTYLSYRTAPLTVAAEESFSATFLFRLPYLPTGDFSVTVALAEGTQDSHVQHHWLDDALFFRVHASHVARGLMGVPMLDITLRPTAL
jgi:lipopolysaccharide transport system ATP-binding protein